MLAFAGLSDLADGWIARTWTSQASKLGSFLDPVADKLLVGTLFLSLTWVGLIPIPLTCLVVARDVALVAAASYIRYRSLPPPVRTIILFIYCTSIYYSTQFVGRVMISENIGEVLRSYARYRTTSANADEQAEHRSAVVLGRWNVSRSGLSFCGPSNFTGLMLFNGIHNNCGWCQLFTIEEYV